MRVSLAVHENPFHITARMLAQMLCKRLTPVIILKFICSGIVAQGGLFPSQQCKNSGHINQCNTADDADLCRT